MDKIQLTTIAIAALAGAVAKAIVDWIVSIIKTTKTVITVTDKIKAIFSKNNRKVLWDIVVIMFYVSVLINFASKDTSPSRLEILIIVGASFAILFMVVRLAWHIGIVINDRENKT